MTREIDPRSPRAAAERVPVGDRFDEMEDDGRRFVVLHDGVGVHRSGAMVAASEFGPGAEIGRMVRLGAIMALSPEQVRAREEAAAARELADEARATADDLAAEAALAHTAARDIPEEA